MDPLKTGCEDKPETKPFVPDPIAKWAEAHIEAEDKRRAQAWKRPAQEIVQDSLSLKNETAKVAVIPFPCPVCGCSGELWVIDSPGQKEKLFQACCARNPWHKANIGERCAMTPIPDPPINDSQAVVRAWRLASALAHSK